VSERLERAGPTDAPEPLPGSGVASDAHRNISSRALGAALWVAQTLLAGIFAAAGAFKITMPPADLAKTFPWALEVPQPLVNLVGAVELLAAVAMMVPPRNGFGAAFRRLAAASLAIVMTFATAFHLARGEPTASRVTMGLGILAAFVAWGRSRERGQA
jgi:uncharacterized membrane protein YphA (DoxX/SURF4 family)